MVIIIYGTKIPNLVYDNLKKSDQFNELIKNIIKNGKITFYMDQIKEVSYAGFEFFNGTNTCVKVLNPTDMNDFTDQLRDPFNKLFTPIMETWNKEIIKANKELSKDFKEGMDMDEMIKERFPDLVVGDSITLQWLLLNKK